MLATDAACVAGVQRPEGATIGFHVCRGNQSSMWMGEGDYEPIAERLFGTLPVDRFLLEYDDADRRPERSRLPGQYQRPDLAPAQQRP